MHLDLERNVDMRRDADGKGPTKIAAVAARSSELDDLGVQVLSVSVFLELNPPSILWGLS